MAVQFIADSTADLPLELRERWGVQIVPAGAVFNGQLFLQDIDMTLEEFYARLPTVKNLPTTTHVNPETFQEIIAPIIDAGDETVIFCVSSTLSGTYQAACIAAKEFPAGKVFVVDTNTVTIGAAVLISRGAQLRQEGATASQIAQEMERLRERIVLYAIIDDLTYPCRGGRLSAVSARVGGVLRLKPVVTIWKGVANIVGLARGMKNAYRWLAERIVKDGIDEFCSVVFGHTNAPALAPELQQALFPDGCPYQSMVHAVGMVLGIHAGPGAVGLAYIKKNG